jgi:cbb3-type cytochrome oxidase subunit 3
MKQAALSQWDLPWLPVTALILFVICFLIYTYWTYKKENKQFYEHASLVPLNEPKRIDSFTKGQDL